MLKDFQAKHREGERFQLSDSQETQNKMVYFFFNVPNVFIENLLTPLTLTH